MIDDLRGFLSKDIFTEMKNIIMKALELFNEGDIRFSHTEGFWDAYSLFKNNQYITGIYTERDKIIPILCKNKKCIKFMTKESMYEMYREDGSFTNPYINWNINKWLEQKRVYFGW